jgi:hypothetical protein
VNGKKFFNYLKKDINRAFSTKLSSPQSLMTTQWTIHDKQLIRTMTLVVNFIFDSRKKSLFGDCFFVIRAGQAIELN